MHAGQGSRATDHKNQANTLWRGGTPGEKDPTKRESPRKRGSDNGSLLSDTARRSRRDKKLMEEGVRKIEGGGKEIVTGPFTIY
jgi:hypothetical protein